MKAIKVEKTEAFIEAYETEKCLWDVCSVDYKNRDEKQKALSRLCAECDMSGKIFFIANLNLILRLLRRKAKCLNYRLKHQVKLKKILKTFHFKIKAVIYEQSP